jgi:hypothetical protein
MMILEMHPDEFYVFGSGLTVAISRDGIQTIGGQELRKSSKSQSSPAIG